MALEREKRTTAGKRMTSLVGKALEDDSAFWGHDTWEEDSQSFHSSDEDSALKVDQFDSDFDESESDHEDEEREAGVQEEKEIQREERQQKKKSYVDLARKDTKKGKQLLGDGMNAGIVLNIPGGKTKAARPKIVGAPKPAIAAPVRPKITLASTRERRSTTVETASQSIKRDTFSGDEAKKKATRKKLKFRQEQLLLEAVHETEPENERWLLTRQRYRDQKDTKDANQTSASHGKIIERYHSRRGTLNTINFPEMDHIPQLFKAKPVQTPESTLCHITGKPARYRDPKTMLGYYDITAFKEIRRKLEAGEIKPVAVKAPKKKPEKKPEPTVVDLTSETQNGATTETVEVKKEPSKGRKRKAPAKSDKAATTEKKRGRKKKATQVKKEEKETETLVEETKPDENIQKIEESNKESEETNGVHPETPTSQDVSARKDSIASVDSNNSRKSPRRRKPSARILENST